MKEANISPSIGDCIDTPLNPLISLTRNVIANLSDEELAGLHLHISTKNASNLSLQHQAWFPKITELVRGVGQEIPMLAIEEIRLETARRLNL